VKTITCAFLTAVAALLLSACGGASSAAATSPPAAVTGVATPTSVSVVTAN
jgi:predicted component of type VI protein secretion system